MVGCILAPLRVLIFLIAAPLTRWLGNIGLSSRLQSTFAQDLATVGLFKSGFQPQAGYYDELAEGVAALVGSAARVSRSAAESHMLNAIEYTPGGDVHQLSVSGLSAAVEILRLRVRTGALWPPS